MFCLRTTVWLGITLSALLFAPRNAAQEPPHATVLWIENQVEYRRAGGNEWHLAGIGQTLSEGDELRTGERSGALLRLRDGSTITLDELTTLRTVKRPRRVGLNIVRGIISFFHRDRPGEFDVESGGVNATIRGTEFVFAVTPSGVVTVTLFDGEVFLGNAHGSKQISSGQIATVRPGEPPRATAVILSGDLTAIQWALYYPAILHLEDLRWNPDPSLQRSVEAYRNGDLPAALAAYPAGREPETTPERLYLVGLLLSVGSVVESEKLLLDIEKEAGTTGIARAFRQLISVVRRQPIDPPKTASTTATELMALSYLQQSRALLEESRDAARAATVVAPEFGFAWSRLAELEFSFGRIRDAKRALKEALKLTPRNAEAVALLGFLLAAENRIPEAFQEFDRAIQIDGSLANGWLGRGLCRIRQNELAQGRADLQVAAAVEPQRSLLRSYLAKALAAENRTGKARHELDLARKLDPMDPTPWLYDSFLSREQNEINEAVRNLIRSEELNTNRAIFRSRLLLDQDRAVASANQAAALRDAGLTAQSIQMASRAVSLDYGNAAAHQFLAESYASSDRINLRYEPARVGEYLTANLLAPVGGGLLSPTLSQQEYSRLLERDRLRAFSQTDYLSRGGWVEAGGFSGTFGNSAFLLEGYYESDPGHFSNTDLEHRTLSLQWKQQVGPQDTLYVQLLTSDLTGGYLVEGLDPNPAPDFKFSEELKPIFLTGWHREWTPGSHTLLLAGVVEDELRVATPSQLNFTGHIRGGSLTNVNQTSIQQKYSSEIQMFTLEGQHFYQARNHLAVAGARVQLGNVEVRNEHGTNNLIYAAFLPPNTQRIDSKLSRAELYFYDTWTPHARFSVTAGIAVDHSEYPSNFRNAPLTGGESDRTAILPKAGLLWEMWNQTWFRAAFSRSVGGVVFDQGFRLEPTQVAGFNQAFRSLIPEAVVGPQSSPELETWHLALESRFGDATWWSIGAEHLTSDVDRTFGMYLGEIVLAPAMVVQQLDYKETSLTFNAAQLFGPHLSLAVNYRVSLAELARRTPEVPPAYHQTFNGSDEEAILSELRLSVHFNHPTGFFATADALWLTQINEGRGDWDEDKELMQFNFWAGYRFYNRRAELSAGILNISDQDYRLHPISFRSALERERTFAARFRWNL